MMMASRLRGGTAELELRLEGGMVPSEKRR